MNSRLAGQTYDLSRAEVREELFSRYRHLRAVGMQLNNKLVKRLGRDVLDEGARKLGILKNGTLVFDSEDQMSVLMDYCIFNVYRNGKNAVDEYLLDCPPPPDSDEMCWFEAMQRAIYSLFVVEEVVPGFGVIVRDLRSNESILVIDRGFGSSARVNLVLASRILFHDDFAMTGGAALPVGALPKKERDRFLETMGLALPPGDQEKFDPARLIRAALMRGASMHVAYEDANRPSSSLADGPEPPGRNSPCPCGSGKKYKQCCMKKR